MILGKRVSFTEKHIHLHIIIHLRSGVFCSLALMDYYESISSIKHSKQGYKLDFYGPKHYL